MWYGPALCPLKTRTQLLAFGSALAGKCTVQYDTESVYITDQSSPCHAIKAW